MRINTKKKTKNKKQTTSNIKLFNYWNGYTSTYISIEWIVKAELSKICSASLMRLKNKKLHSLNIR